ncbi:SCO0930 family lipoprotein [Streptomyces sp. NPDC058548]|uniref:SCO0930 family lipoprotein n=1 Tax=unclassified Streptomyces TaxID=2593676 RepID=UPI00364BBFBD
MKQVRGTWLATAVAVVMLTAACGAEPTPKDGQGDQAPGKSVNPASAPPKPPAPGGASPGGASRAPGALAIWPSTELGPVLTDSAGFTLYRFDKDTAEPPKSNCDGDCAAAWPPVPAGAGAPPGVDPKLIGSVTRKDGSKQLTVAGWPMYRFAQDAAPRDTKGQGVGGVWFAAAPDGKKAAKGAGAPSQAPKPPAQKLPGLSVRNDPKLGPIIVDGRGFTVYRFTKDTNWPMKSACTADCLANWPVVAPVPEKNTKGITSRNYLVLNRPDGAKQQTIDCWPVYTFAADTKPGDTKGQGAGGVWFAVSPEGKLVGAKK